MWGIALFRLLIAMHMVSFHVMMLDWKEHKWNGAKEREKIVDDLLHSTKRCQHTNWKNSVADCKALVDDAYYFLDPVVQAWESIFVFPCFNFLLSKTLSTFILLNNHTSIVFSFPKISSFIVQHWQPFRRCHRTFHKWDCACVFMFFITLPILETPSYYFIISS